MHSRAGNVRRDALGGGRLIDSSKNDGNGRPNSVAQLQSIVERRRADDNDNTDRLILIFFAKKSFETLRITLAFEPKKIKMLEIKGDGFSGIIAYGRSHRGNDSVRPWAEMRRLIQD